MIVEQGPEIFLSDLAARLPSFEQVKEAFFLLKIGVVRDYEQVEDGRQLGCLDRFYQMLETEGL